MSFVIESDRSLVLIKDAALMFPIIPQGDCSLVGISTIYGVAIVVTRD